MTGEQVPADGTREGPAENALLGGAPSHGELLGGVRDALGEVPPGTLAAVASWPVSDAGPWDADAPGAQDTGSGPAARLNRPPL